MRLFIDSVMVFLGTLMAAALLALAGPAGLEPAMAQHARSVHDVAAQVLAASPSHYAEKASLPRAPR